MTKYENLIKAIRFDSPDYIPMNFVTNPACWNHYSQDRLQELMANHPMLFPDFVPRENVVPEYSPCSRANEPFRDDWGCVWETSEDGIVGVVTQHPLENWDALDCYIPPDPEASNGLISHNWSDITRQIKEAVVAGETPYAGLEHGHTFLRLCDLRGYQNVLFDMCDEDSRLLKLIEIVENFNMGIVTRYLESGAEFFSYPEDLGMQIGPMLSPDMFRKYIKPSYQRLMDSVRKAGCIVHMHSDGDIRQLADDLIDGGVEVLNLQDLVNGIDWIAEKFAGKVCIDLDIDRQNITYRGTPQQIDDLIREEVETLGSRQGGLSMIYGLYPGVPIENVKALMDAMERYSTYY